MGADMKRWILPVVAGAAVALAGCGSTGAASGTATGVSASSGTAPAATSTATSGTSGSSGISGASGSSTTTSAGVGECRTAQLSGSLSDASGAAGSVYYHLVLTNKSTSSCYVQGYPGVSFVTTPNGSPVGAPAQRRADPSAPGIPRVTLTTGASAHSVLQVVEAANFPASRCGMTKVPGLRVYPPNQTTSLYVPAQEEACSDSSTVVMDVEPLHAGA